MRHADLSCRWNATTHQHDYFLRIEEHAWWADVFEAAWCATVCDTMWAISEIGGALHEWAERTGPEPWLRKAADWCWEQGQLAEYRLINVHGADWLTAQQKLLADIPVTREQAMDIDPEWVVEQEEQGAEMAAEDLAGDS